MNQIPLLAPEGLSPGRQRLILLKLLGLLRNLGSFTVSEGDFDSGGFLGGVTAT